MLESIVAFASEFAAKYVNVTYIIAVVFVTEFVKKFAPSFLKSNKKNLTLVVAFTLMLGFFAWEITLGTGSNMILYTQRMFMSFPGVTAFYDYILKPIIGKLKPNGNE